MVVSERGDDRRAHAETAAQPARHVVFAAALPDAKLTRGSQPALARVQSQHHLTERHQVIAAFLRGPDGEAAHARASATSVTASSLSDEIAAKSLLRISSGATIQLPPIAATAGSRR